MATPSEDDISTLQAVVACDRDTAVRYLKAKGCNVEQAVTALLDGEDLQKDTWDDSVWAADRDTNLHPLGSAPTRGNSPVGTYRHPTSKEQEDADMAAAMSASFNQEQGVIRTDGSVRVYGPEYNPNEWALVKTTTTTEVTPDVNPLDRRSDLQPRFLKPTNDYLPNFITICHSIPAARNLFLIPGYTRMTYGSNPEWWKGQEIQLPRIVHISDGSPTDPQLARYDDFIAETQRLVAFLDSSDRAYATTANLERYSGLRYHGKSQASSLKTNINTFIEELAQATHTVSHGDAVEDLFALHAGSDTGDIDSHIMEVFDFDVETEHNLSRILDNVLWDIDDDEPEDRYLEKLPGVMIMRLKQHSTTLQVKAPGTLFMDKYLRENLEEMKPVRASIGQSKKRLSKIEEVEKQLKTWKHAEKQMDALELLSQTQDQFSTPNGYNAINIADELERIISSINHKLVVLDAEKKKAQEALAQLSAPPETLQDHRYTLTGVATKPGITYILRPQAEDEQSLLDHDDETPAKMQWWRIEYSINGTAPSITRTRLASYDVLGAIEHEHHTALLIYASDDALNPPQIASISAELQEFIQTDNTFFGEELRDIPPPTYPFDVSMNDADRPRESIERKASMDSLIAQQPDSPDHGDFNDDPTRHASFNLGYGADTEFEDAPVHEIPPPSDSIDMTDQVHNNSEERPSGHQKRPA